MQAHVSDSTLDSLVAAWLRARPPMASALAYLRADERAPFTALACLEQQWIETTYGVEQPIVAQAKLGWWLEELEAARGGRAHHPFTVALFAHRRARAIDAALWGAPVVAAMRLRDAGGAADLERQLAIDAPLFAALAALENALWFGAGGGSDRAARLGSLGHLVAALGRLGTPTHAGAAALPMNLLARHHLVTDDLANQSPARTAALHDQLDALDAAWTQADALAGPLTLFRALAARSDRRLLRRARRASRPLPELAAGARHVGLGDTLAAWRLARAWRAG